MTTLEKTKKGLRKVRKVPGRVINQFRKPLPKWARWVRNIGIAVAVVAGNIATAGTLFPATVVTIASYAAWTGTVAVGVAQAFSE